MLVVARLRVVFPIVFLLFIASVAAAQAKRAMTVDDVIDLVQVSAPRMSPDGRRVIYTLSELGTWKDNKRVTSIWIADTDGSNARRFLANEKDRSPAWSPDGLFVAFLSTRDAAAAAHDLMTGVDTLIADGIADPDRLAVRGWSYGGILGGWALTQTTRFKAASLGAMVADWASEYAMGFNHDVRLWYIGGTPWESAEAYRHQSSFTHIAKVTTPTLLLHGERDTTDTIGQSMMYYRD